MEEQDEVQQEQESFSIQENSSGSNSSGPPPFVDNRPEALEQRELQQSLSGQSVKFVDNRPEALEQQQLQQSLQSSGQQEKNQTGIPDQLKEAIEKISGLSLNDVKVHYNSEKPAQLNALAYAQGTDIYIAPGQEKHLAQEVWHVVQQKEGRVAKTMELQGVALNDDGGLEQEANVMGTKALNSSQETTGSSKEDKNSGSNGIVQRQVKVGVDSHDAAALELLLKEIDGFEWKAMYSDVLTKFDQSGEEFTKIEEVVASLKHVIVLTETPHTLSELNYSQELFYESDTDTLQGIWDTLDALGSANLRADDRTIKEQIKNKAYNAIEMIGLQNGIVDQWEETYNIAPGEGDTLHDYAYAAIVEAIGDTSKISGMSYDEIYNYNAETQIAYCLLDCRDNTEDVLALSLYTSYFYEPLNSYFRGLSEPDEGTYFGQLVLKAAATLLATYEATDAIPIDDKRYKLELKSGWINDNAVSINFAAPTSTHPNINGVKGMWGDIAEGTFGAYDNFALLIFEGSAKFKRPHKKYFPGESEDLMAPGSEFPVIDSYTLNGNIPNIGQKDIRVFSLSNVPNQEAGDRISFDDLML